MMENLKIKPLEWVEREIDLASLNFGMPCVQPCTKLKLESYVQSCPTSSGHNFKTCQIKSCPCTAQNPPLVSIATVFSAVLAAGSWWRKGEIQHLPGFTKLENWWNRGNSIFYYILARIQRVSEGLKNYKIICSLPSKPHVITQKAPSLTTSKNSRLVYVASWSNWGFPQDSKGPVNRGLRRWDAFSWFAVTANRKYQNTFANCHHQHQHHHPPPPPWWSDEKSKSAPSRCQTWKVWRILHFDSPTRNRILLDHLWKQSKRAALKNYFVKIIR